MTLHGIPSNDNAHLLVSRPKRRRRKFYPDKVAWVRTQVATYRLLSLVNEAMLPAISAAIACDPYSEPPEQPWLGLPLENRPLGTWTLGELVALCKAREAEEEAREAEKEARSSTVVMFPTRAFCAHRRD